MSSKYNFYFRTDGSRQGLPAKIILARDPLETRAHIILRILTFLLFRRDRMQVRTALHNESIPFIPDLAQMDYEMRPVLWVECGDCSVAKLNKLAVKVPEAEIWVVKSSAAEVEFLQQGMKREELRRNRYQFMQFDPDLVAELAGLLRPRNEIYWVRGQLDPPEMQFDFNGLWFEAPYQILEF